MFDKALYDIWRGMIGRCHDRRHISYQYYGERGIAVCDEWRESYHVFVRDMGPRPSGHTLERKKSTEDYSLSNCRWATVTEQNNNKSDTRLITWNGKTQNMTAWAAEIGISAAALHYRLTKMKLSIEDAFCIPVTRFNRGERFGGEK
jgi:hypothetical protein